MSEVYPRYNIATRSGARVAYRVSARRANVEGQRLEWEREPYDIVEYAAPPRFRIKMAKHRTASPVKLADRERPAFVGHYRTVTDACRAADNIVRRERGMPERIGITPAEVRGRMMPCYIEPILPAEYVEEGVNR